MVCREDCPVGAMEAEGSKGLHERLYRYNLERSLRGQGLTAVPFFLGVYLSTRAAGGFGLELDTRAVPGMLTVLLVFVHLRVMDDLKDADHDALRHPERPLPRGLVTAGELRGLLLLVITAEVALNAPLWMPVLAAYLGVLGYSLLLYREFFARAMLRQRPHLYWITHVLCAPFLAVYVAVLAVT